MKMKFFFFLYFAYSIFKLMKLKNQEINQTKSGMFF